MFPSPPIPSNRPYQGAPMECVGGPISSCSASTTATNSHRREYSAICDWLSGRHVYLHPVESRNSGRVMKIDPDGVIEWESESWENIRCPSSDTSIRVKCDGKALYFSGNIGRFQQTDNRLGLTVVQCLEKWAEVLNVLGFDLTGFGVRHRQDTFSECGTFFSRVDLASNFETDNYSALSQSLMNRRLGQLMPKEGKWGPTWGYDKGRRSNWIKAKLYDKDAELSGKRRGGVGATTARFEVQLGGEWLKRNGLDGLSGWCGGDDMDNVIYGRFASQVLREQISTESWDDITPRLRAYAVLWRDGVDIRSVLSLSQYYKVRKQLLESYGLDIGIPCNVLSLSRRVQTVTVTPLNCRRAA